jgi:GT2 family glycosyltransferase
MFVSVIMPIYNGEAFLGEAIESVLAQTHRNFELVAGSTTARPTPRRRSLRSSPRRTAGCG